LYPIVLFVFFVAIFFAAAQQGLWVVVERYRLRHAREADTRSGILDDRGGFMFHLLLEVRVTPLAAAGRSWRR
jgi:hypothetical protein